MAVPKKKTSPSRQGMRWAHKHVSYDALQECSHCGEAKRPHHLCPHCGYYRGQVVLLPKARRRELKAAQHHEGDE